MKNEPFILTAEDGKFIVNQLAAALAIITGLRKYLEQTGKLQSAELRQFRAAETALQAIKVKPTISSRASEVAKRINQTQRGKIK